MRWTNYQLSMTFTSKTVTWARPLKGGWHSFKWANLNLLGMQQGIYILWYPETDRRAHQVAYVGQGIIKHRVNSHRGNWSRIMSKIAPRHLLLPGLWSPIRATVIPSSGIWQRL